MLIGLTELGAGLVVFLGACFCCTVPRASEGTARRRGLIVCLILTVILGILAAVVYVSAMTRAWQWTLRWWAAGRDVTHALALPGALVLAAFGQSLCFFMLLRGVARDFGDRELGGNFIAYFVTSIIVPIFLFGGAFVLGASMATGGGGMRDQMAFVGILGCVSLVVGLGMFIWLLTLLSRLYNVIPDGSGSRRYPYGGGGRW